MNGKQKIGAEGGTNRRNASGGNMQHRERTPPALDGVICKGFSGEEILGHPPRLPQELGLALLTQINVLIPANVQEAHTVRRSEIRQAVVRSLPLDQLVHHAVIVGKWRQLAVLQNGADQVVGEDSQFPAHVLNQLLVVVRLPQKVARRTALPR